MPWETVRLPPERRGIKLNGRIAGLTKAGILTLGKDALALWSEGPAYVEVKFDRERWAIGLRPSTNPDDFMLKAATGAAERVNLAWLVRKYGLRLTQSHRMLVALEGGLLVMVLPEEVRVDPEDLGGEEGS